MSRIKTRPNSVSRHLSDCSHTSSQTHSTFAHLVMVALRPWRGGTCQKSTPCFPLVAPTMSSSKAAPAEGVQRPFSPHSSSAWLHPWSAHSWTLNSFRLPNVGTSATSDSKSKPIITTTELVLSFKLGGLGTHNLRQLPHTERARRFLLIILVCRELRVLTVFQKATGIFTPWHTAVRQRVRASQWSRQSWQPWWEVYSICMIAAFHSVCTTLQ